MESDLSYLGLGLDLDPTHWNIQSSVFVWCGLWSKLSVETAGIEPGAVPEQDGQPLYLFCDKTLCR